MDTYTTAMLFDFYGSMLTKKQYDAIDYYINEDMSLGEIAQYTGVTRQGARDNIKRASNTLLGLEEKLGFVKKYMMQMKRADALQQMMRSFVLNDKDCYIIKKEEFKEIMDQIMEVIGVERTDGGS